MKRGKLLTSLCCLGLILSLTGCNQNDGTPNDDSESESIKTLFNYTLNITLSLNDETTTLPEYGVLYIIGDWDNWNEFVPLTLTNESYTYTFSSISVGVHSFKGVAWYEGEIVSWSDCVEVITDFGENATFEVFIEDGNDATKILSYEMSNELPPLGKLDGDALDVASEILCAINPTNSGPLSKLWEASYIKDTNYLTEEENSYYITTNEYGYVDGVWDNVMQNNMTSFYIIAQSCYMINEDGSSSWSDIFAYNYDGILQIYDDILSSLYNTFIADNNFILKDGYKLEVERVSSGYYLTLACSGITTILETDHHYNIISISEEMETKTYFAEKLSREEVKNKIINYPNNMSLILSSLGEETNFTLSVYFDVYQSDYYSESDYIIDMMFGIEPAFTSFMEFKSDYYFTDDALLIIHYAIDENEEIPMGVELYINDYENSITNAYYLSDEAESVTDLVYVGYLSGPYQEYFFTLQYLENYIDSFELGATYQLDDYDTEEYTTSDIYLMNTLLNLAVFNNTLATYLYFDQILYYDDFLGLKYYPIEDLIYYCFDYYGWFYGYDYIEEDGEFRLDYENPLYFTSEYFLSAIIYDIGTSTIPEEFTLDS